MRYAAILTLLASVITAAQSAPPAFEVASVKPNNSGSTSFSSRAGRGSLTASNTPLRRLIIQAYGVRDNRLVGPSWIDTARFDINARAPEGTTDGALYLLLRTLLTERFKLVMKTEMREQPIYALVLANVDGRLGSGIRRAAECDKSRGGGGAGSPAAAVASAALTPCGTRSTTDARGSMLTGGVRPIADLATALEAPAERVVIDRTGLTGTYNYELRFARPNLQNAGQDSELPVVFTALQEQLGLKLESARGPVEFLVIDRVEQPTPD